MPCDERCSVQCIYVLQRRSPAAYVVTTGILRQQYDASAVVSVHVHMVPALYRILTGSFTRLIFYGLSLLVRTRNALQNELTINGTRAVLSARAHLLDVIFGDCDKHSLTVYPANGYGKPAVLTL